MKSAVALAVLAATMTAAAFDGREPTLREPPLVFLPPDGCAEAPDVRQCLVAAPKEWSRPDRDLLEHTLARLASNELARGLLVGARENGYRGLRRFSTDTQFDPVRGPVPKFSPGFVLYRSKTIGLTDLFFTSADVHDALAGYRFGDLIVLHELVHAFDDRTLSADASFRASTGWIFQNNRWVYSNPVNLSAYNGVRAETLTLYARGRIAEAWSRDRGFATSMVVPLPTIQSLASPAESFADILAHLLLDERAQSYLRPDIVEWFQQTVFPILRENAQRF